MAEEVQQDGQKTLVAFIVGLLIGGMLVWAFSGPEAAAPAETDPDTAAEETMSEEEDGETAEETTDQGGDVTESAPETEPAPELSVGEGNIVVNDQPAGYVVEMEGATYPVSEGWVGVRDYVGGDLSYIKGVVRFSESQGIVPENIALQYPTIAGREYAVVVFEEDGDFEFSTAGDVQVPEIYSTFTAQ